MTTINSADALYLGASSVDRVYKGTSQVWPAGGGGTPIWFGNQDVSNVNTFPHSDDRAFASVFTLAADANIVTAYARFSSVSGGSGVGTSNFKVHVYAQSAGVPTTLIATSTPGAVTALDAWLATPLGVFLPAGTYALVVSAESPAYLLRWQSRDGVGTLHLANGSFPYGTPPDPWPGSAATYTQTLCVYVEGTEA